MFIVPEEFKPLLSQLQVQFTRAATARRMLWLMFAAVLVSGNRTISNLLRLLSLLQAVNPSTYHRVLSHRSWNTNYLAKVLIGFLLDRYIPTGKIRLSVMKLSMVIAVRTSMPKRVTAMPFEVLTRTPSFGMGTSGSC